MHARFSQLAQISNRTDNLFTRVFHRNKCPYCLFPKEYKQTHALIRHTKECWQIMYDQKRQIEPESAAYNSCIRCVAKEINSVFVPCGHTISCYECSTHIFNFEPKCPVCTTEATAIIKMQRI